MREYDGGSTSVAELYFSNANDECATRFEEEFVTTHSRSMFAAVAPLAASENNFINPYMWFKQGRSNGRIALTHHLKSYVNVYFTYPVQQRRPLHQLLHLG
jgi:hypothetical protein